MHLATLEAALEAPWDLKRDLIIAVVSDEETGMTEGSRFLVEEHPELVRAEFALGEVGGFNITVMGQKIFPVQVAEKGICWLRATVRGEPGHGSVPNTDSAVVKLGRALTRIGRKRLPVHISGPSREYLEGLAAALPQPGRTVITLLQNEKLAGVVLDVGLRQPEIKRPLQAALTNTASPTVVNAGDKVNVIPATAEVLIDGRTLPGQGPGDLVRELKGIAPELDFEVIQAQSSAQASSKTPMFQAITESLARHAPDGHVVPMLLPGMTDAKSWSQLGTQCYGFMPLLLPEDFPPVFELIHGHDERVPVDAFRVGTRVFVEAVRAVSR